MEEFEDGMTAPGQRELAITVIIPVYNAGHDLKCCLQSLKSAGQQGCDIILVDDASTDGAAETCAREFAARYHRFETGPNGPAMARNLGAKLSPESDAYLFIDSDVSIAPGAIDQFRQVLIDSPDIAAAFGSYDEYPPAPGWISQYKNLLHHYMHQIGNPEASTFWSGCGIVRRSVFETMNGFDEKFGAASIEDIDLGIRMNDAGYRVRLCRDIRCRHHKNWTLMSWLRTDIFARALPWSRLLVARDTGVPNTLNLGYG
jgi:GT2 family glycosyltransferase